VTSNLDPEIQTADHSQGGGGAGRVRLPGPNFFVINILTSKFFEVRILQGISCQPDDFKDSGGRGDTPESAAHQEFRTRVSLQLKQFL
jgi:hypothetical protein